MYGVGRPSICDTISFAYFAEICIVSKLYPLTPANSRHWLLAVVGGYFTCDWIPRQATYAMDEVTYTRSRLCGRAADAMDFRSQTFTTFGKRVDGKLAITISRFSTARLSLRSQK